MYCVIFNENNVFIIGKKLFTLQIKCWSLLYFHDDDESYAFTLFIIAEMRKSIPLFSLQ